MLRKSVTAIAIAAGLVGFTGPSFAQQAPAKSAVTSSVQRVGAAAGQTNQWGDAGVSPFTHWTIFGISTVVIIWSANDNDSNPISK